VDTQNNQARAKRTWATILIEPFKQIKMGLYVLAVCIGFVLLAGALFVAGFWEQYKHVMTIFNVVDPNLQWELVTNRVFYINTIRMAVLFASFIGLLMAVVFRMTHRIYGPLVSIERFVEQIADGQYDKRVKIRNKDELKRLVSKLNNMAERIEARQKGIEAPCTSVSDNAQDSDKMAS
jgi:HAMP domain-containing protein